MQNLKVLSVRSKKENPTYNELSILRTHARSISFSRERDIVELLEKSTEGSITLEVGRNVYDCAGPGWSHSCNYEILGEATYAIGNPWDSI